MLSEIQLKNIIQSGILERVENIEQLKFVFNLTEEEWDKMELNSESSVDSAQDMTYDVDYKLSYISKNNEEDFINLSCNFNILEKDINGEEDIVDSYNINSITTFIDHFKLIELEDVLDLSEASEKYNLNINTLKTICQKGLHNLSEGLDYKKAGRVWLITRKAIEEKILKNKNKGE